MVRSVDRSVSRPPVRSTHRLFSRALLRSMHIEIVACSDVGMHIEIAMDVTRWDSVNYDVRAWRVVMIREVPPIPE